MSEEEAARFSKTHPGVIAQDHGFILVDEEGLFSLSEKGTLLLCPKGATIYTSNRKLINFITVTVNGSQPSGKPLGRS